MIGQTKLGRDRYHHTRGSEYIYSHVPYCVVLCCA